MNIISKNGVVDWFGSYGIAVEDENGNITVDVFGDKIKMRFL